MNNNELIKNLANELKPVEPWSSPEKRTILWILLNFTLIGVVLFFTQPNNASVQLELLSFHFIMDILFFASSSILGVYLGFLSVIPGTNKGKIRIIFILSICLLLMSLGFGILSPVESLTGTGTRPFCKYEVLFFSLIPMISFGVLVFRGFFVDKFKAFVPGLFAGAVIPAGYMHILCGNEPIHALLFHIGPALVPLVIGMLSLNYLIKENP